MEFSKHLLRLITIFQFTPQKHIIATGVSADMLILNLPDECTLNFCFDLRHNSSISSWIHDMISVKNHINPVIVFSLPAIIKRAKRVKILPPQMPTHGNAFYSFDRLGFPIKFSGICSMHLTMTSAILVHQENSGLVTLHKLAAIVFSIESVFETPEFSVFFLPPENQNATFNNSFENVKYLEVGEPLNETSFSNFEKLMRKISSKVLFSLGAHLFILCLPCIMKGKSEDAILHKLSYDVNSNYPVRFENTSVIEVIEKMWAIINTNFHKRVQTSPGLSNLFQSCNDMNYIFTNITPRDADMWDARCLNLHLRHKFNHSLSLSFFLGLGHVYLATLLKLDEFNQTHRAHEDRIRISGHGLLAKGFIYRIFLRSSDHPTTALGYKSLIHILDLPSWICSIIIFVVAGSILSLAGMKNSFFWLLSDLLEKGVRVRKTNVKFSLPVILWSLSTLIFRNLYCSDMISQLTSTHVPPVPENLEELVLQNKIPILSHTYDFLKLNYTQSIEISEESMTFLTTVRKNIFRVRDLLTRASLIVNDVALRGIVEMGGVSLNYFSVPSDFSVLFLSEDLPIFEIVFRAFASVHENSNDAFILGKNFPVIFPRLKSWIIPNSFVADLVLQDIATFYESGIYDRLLQVRQMNRIISRFNTNDNVLDVAEMNCNLQKNGFCDKADSDGSSGSQRHVQQPRWSSFLSSTENNNNRAKRKSQTSSSSDEEDNLDNPNDNHNGQSDNGNSGCRAFSVESLHLVWIVYITCATCSAVAFIGECVLRCVFKWRHDRVT